MKTNATGLGRNGQWTGHEGEAKLGQNQRKQAGRHRPAERGQGNALVAGLMAGSMALLFLPHQPVEPVMAEFVQHHGLLGKQQEQG
jgi:hypothetical protein